MRSVTHELLRVLLSPRHLHLDVPAIEKHFYVLSRKLHPDRFAGKSLAEQESALAQSSLLNDAYRTLKDPSPAPSTCSPSKACS